MISKIVKVLCVALVWYMYFALTIRAIAYNDLAALITSILWSFAALMVFPPFKGGGV
jgi:hypothetical protein